jgi:hypothetical protein
MLERAGHETVDPTLTAATLVGIRHVGAAGGLMTASGADDAFAVQA